MTYEEIAQNDPELVLGLIDRGNVERRPRELVRLRIYFKFRQ